MQIESKVATAYPELAEAVELFEGKGSQFENVFEDYLKIVDAEPDRITWEFCPNDKHVNRFGNLHGGLIAAVIDVCSSFAIKLSSGIKWNLIGISVDLSVSYLRGVPPGSPIRLVCQLERIGNRLATIYTRVYDNDNNLCYTSTHTKYRTDPKL
ncbi:Thioesterase/thiol ester dehydrase-isomerase [Rhizopus microsporus var. microsporus]|uniref:Thioesterase/thiol ester dehydrase-isomerase n=2 Tax=Rhizopus microsporus TaxID=58291 RepID=A0A2G4SYX5_RHIZD|nr:Thioesterase/thiol ester dehydrase-isomerase [Rhizopus microsporus ATCC 52813]ORE11732.1 Thioesterase/thiol ester dehydrase-isomerase [Rhizopus microsporus var. microsporus]PHZ13983.1 Thioesterase/thiol ester dehydrase-isomerase [Rhizopus microsporus ATCC 52813]